MVERVLIIILIVVVAISIAFMSETVSDKSKRIVELERINRDLVEINKIYSQNIEIMTHMVEGYNKVFKDYTY